MRTGNPEPAASTLASDVRFGSCVGLPQVVDHLDRMLRHVTVSSAEVDALPDRLIATFPLDATGAVDGRCRALVAFLRDGRIVELQAARFSALRRYASSP